MKVILLQDVKKIGKRMGVREVPDGYARNFLFPKGMAKAATKEAIFNLEKEKGREDQRKNEAKEKAKVLAQKASEITLLIKAKAGEKGELFGSIGEKEIIKELEKKAGIKAKEVILEHHIKNLGKYEIEVDFGEGEKEKIKVEVVKE
ncbi:MAG: 50S ribosomal protein L9 [Candidatus Liptonbacteria bacterium RIFOXYD1_FULL_36_11]|uniref:Large ribosomal subunit protein bL9 n=1 Tax=Candidatus Liptonbacteria bacterium RIFOXYD1_FULL_36_11 TaxID=1798656 RepID=A0A1G2CU15_9BACT|nr:MAG: 50S ribosomal protein L9 [Candidatus Liptonbacteria bacterium RIFOXYD1_FULL_36_11]